jgi:glutamate--cysteine ligase
VELRSLDVSAFDPLGINPEQARFLEAFLVFCLLHESPPISAREQTEIDHNLMVAATRGREPGLQLQHGGRSRPLQAWAAEICELMQGVSELLDAGRADQAYRRALESQGEIVHDPERTPSARVLAEMREHGESFFHFAKRMSQAHQRFFQGLPVNESRMARFQAEAAASFARQQALEAEDTIPFEEYLRRYFAQS